MKLNREKTENQTFAEFKYLKETDYTVFYMQQILVHTYTLWNLC